MVWVWGEWGRWPTQGWEESVSPLHPHGWSLVVPPCKEQGLGVEIISKRSKMILFTLPCEPDSRYPIASHGAAWWMDDSVAAQFHIIAIKITVTVTSLVSAKPKHCVGSSLSRIKCNTVQWALQPPPSIGGNWHQEVKQLYVILTRPLSN